MPKCNICKTPQDKRPFKNGCCELCRKAIEILDQQEQYMDELGHLDRWHEYLLSRTIIIQYKLDWEKQQNDTIDAEREGYKEGSC